MRRRLAPLALVLCACGALATASSARATHADPWVTSTLEGRTTPRSAAWLARLMASEGGWDSTADHAAVAWTITRRLEVLSGPRRRRPFRTLDAVILRYARGFVSGRLRRQRWIRELELDGERGASWPAHVPWARPRGRLPSRRSAFLAIAARARAHLAGELPNPCERVPDHWGGPMDRGRARGLLDSGAWEIVDCGETGNEFYRVVRAPRRRVPDLGVVFVDASAPAP